MEQDIRILIVEDSAADFDLLQRYLLKTGLCTKKHILSAVTLKEALECLEQASVDLVLTDLGLPDARGEQVIQGLLENFSHIPTYVFSSDIRVGNYQKTYGDRVKGFFDKGDLFTVDLKSCVFNALSTKERRRDDQAS